MKKLIALILGLILLLCGCAQSTVTPSASGSEPVTSEPAAPDSSSDVNPTTGGVLQIALTGDAGSLSGLKMRGPTDLTYGGIIYETLLAYDENGDPQPFLAESVTEDSEALTYTIVLRQGILFHDGSELTAEVVKWNLELYKEEGVQGSSLLPTLDYVEVKDNYTAVLHLTQWDSTLPYSLGRQAGYMMSKLAYDTNGADYVAEHPVTTAPFIVESWEHDVSMTFTKYKDYWQGEPYLDGIKCIVFAEPMVAQASLEAGDVDVFTYDDKNMIETMKEKGFNIVYSTVPNTCITIGFNCEIEGDPLNDIRVRQAIGYAIDSQAICDTLLLGATVTNQYALPGATYYSTDVTASTFDLEKAKTLLTEAGYADGFNTTITVGPSQTGMDACVIIAEQLSKAGINVDINQVDQAGFNVAIDGWGTGMIYHPMGLRYGTPLQIVGSYIQGLKTGIGLTNFPHPDELNDTILDACKSGAEESVKLFKDAQYMIFEKYDMLKAIAITPVITMENTKVHDAGIGERTVLNNTLWKAWKEK